MPDGWMRALEQGGGLVEQVADLRAGHRADGGGVAERQDLEHVAVGQQHGIVRPEALAEQSVAVLLQM